MRYTMLIYVLLSSQGAHSWRAHETLWHDGVIRALGAVLSAKTVLDSRLSKEEQRANRPRGRRVERPSITQTKDVDEPHGASTSYALFLDNLSVQHYLPSRQTKSFSPNCPIWLRAVFYFTIDIINMRCTIFAFRLVAAFTGVTLGIGSPANIHGKFYVTSPERFLAKLARANATTLWYSWSSPLRDGYFLWWFLAILSLL